MSSSSLEKSVIDGVIFDEVSANLNLHTMTPNEWYKIPALGIVVFLSWDKKFIFIDKLDEPIPQKGDNE